MRIGAEEIRSSYFTINLAEYNRLIFNCMHWHKNIEICRMVKGSCDFMIQGKTYSANEGDVIFINSWELHQYINVLSECTVDIYLFDPIVLYKLHSKYTAVKPVVTREEMEKTDIWDEINECFDKIHEESEPGDKYSEFLLHARTLQLYGVLARHFENKADTEEGEPSKIKSFHEVLSYMSENYAENLTLESVAKHFNYSSGYMSVIFNRYTGMKFKQFLDNIRVDEAINMLLSTNMSVIEISSRCGFENIRTFNNVFKRITGTVPSKVRRK